MNDEQRCVALFQAPCPGHGPVALFGCFVIVFLSGAAFAAFGRHHIYPVFAVGRDYAVEPGQVYSRFRHQGSQLGNDIQRLKDDVRGSITVGRFELIPDSFATWAKQSSSSQAGTRCGVNTLRPCGGPMAMR